MDQRDRIGAIANAPVKRSRPLSGGCVGDVRLIELEDGRRLVAKTGGPGSGLETEGRMLRYLAQHSALPVPEVLSADDDLLLMTWIDGADHLTAAAEIDAAAHVAALHDLTAPRFGFGFETRIGGLAQPNPESDRWLDFFRDHRLRYMAHQAHGAGRLPSSTLARIEALAGRLDRWIEEPPRPALLHGDLWGGNLLCQGGTITGFIDPAIYFGHPEIELAFSTLFSTFGEPFFKAYGERRAIDPGFFEERRDLYNLYPLLVHVRLFGGAYVAAVERSLSQFGV